MDEKQIWENLKGIIMEKLSVTEDQVKKEARYQEDLDADSLDVVELVMAIEEKFNIEVPDEDAEKIRTVGDTLEYIKNKVG